MKQITAKHCAKIRPFPPDQRGNVRPTNIIFVKAVLYAWRTAARGGPCRSGVLERMFAALREQEAVGEEVVCFSLDSTSVKVHPDGTGARTTSGPQSIGK